MQNSISNVPTILPGCFAIHNYHFTLKRAPFCGRPLERTRPPNAPGRQTRPTRTLHTGVAADVSRRYSRCGEYAPTDVGGYRLWVFRAWHELPEPIDAEESRIQNNPVSASRRTSRLPQRLTFVPAVERRLAYKTVCIALSSLNGATLRVRFPWVGKFLNLRCVYVLLVVTMQLKTCSALTPALSLRERMPRASDALCAPESVPAWACTPASWSAVGEG